MLEVSDLNKQYPTAGGSLQILHDVSFSLKTGDALSIMGPSGGGKSTLLFLVGALETPSSGAVRLDGQDPFALPEADLARFRNENVGFVFQDHCLLPQCSVLENVLVPTLVAPKEDYSTRARHLLEEVGLGDRMTHRPGELSGGEKQRVAIARALIREPRLLLCDEPTGNLDGETAEAVGSLLLDLDRRASCILMVVTHSERLADRFPNRMTLERGTLHARAAS